jgi:preprotein translocase subunit SecF
VELFRNAEFDFLGKKWWFILPSLILIAAGLASIVARRGLIYSIDFKGGAEMASAGMARHKLIAFEQPFFEGWKEDPLSRLMKRTEEIQSSSRPSCRMGKMRELCDRRLNILCRRLARDTRLEASR